MHILLVTHYFSPDSGAAAVRLTRLAMLLQKRGHQVTVLATMPHYPQGKIAEQYRGHLVHRETVNAIRLVRVWLWTSPSPRISRKLLSQLSFLLTATLIGVFLPRPDVVLIEAQPIFTGLAGRLISLFKRTPYVLNVSDLWPEHLVSVGALTETHPVYRLAQRLVDSTYRAATAIVAMSPAWAEVIVKRTGDSRKTHIILNGVDLNRFRPGLDVRSFRTSYQLGDARLVTFIGTFATQYDVDAMVEVAVRLSAVQDVCVVFIGAGSQGERLRDQLTKQAHAHIALIDWMGQEEIPAAWAATHITYWMLRDEPLYRGTIPAKLYEALASGVPIVAAMAGEGARLIHESGAGITVEPGDTEAMVDAIKRLLTDEPLYRQCQTRGRQYAEAHFDPEVNATRYEAVLRRAAAGTQDTGG